MPPRGFALVSALFVAGLVAGVAALLVTRQHFLVAAATGLADTLRAERAADALEVAAERVLAPSPGRAPDRVQPPPDLSLPLAAEASGRTASGRLEALDGRFNLNTLVIQSTSTPDDGSDKEEFAGGIAADQLRAVAESAGVRLDAGLRRPGARSLPLLPHQVAAARFVLLLKALGLDTAIVPAILDWVDADAETRAPNGAEDDFYTRLDPPYRAANRGFADPSELLRVRGVTPEVYARLAPFVVAFDQITPLDVNAAPIEILMALAPGIDRPTAETLARTRHAKPWVTLMEFLASPALQTRPLLTQGLAVRSTFYALHASVATSDAPIRFRTVLRLRGERETDRLQRERTYGEN